ncbi:hypothetical protein ColKHC_14248 [Colletotrichum higginsianum]|nr:hypothetical protein ColKHC_14248 [Colletotrichum higginsianum]
MYIASRLPRLNKDQSKDVTRPNVSRGGNYAIIRPLINDQAHVLVAGEHGRHAVAERVRDGAAQISRDPVAALAARLGRGGDALAEEDDDRGHIEALSAQARGEDAQCQEADLGRESHGEGLEF